MQKPVTKKIIFPHCLVLLMGAISIFSCHNNFKYEVKFAEKYEHGGGQYGLSAGINIPAKMPKEDLLKLGHQLRRRWSDILLMDVRIFVPSDYPDDPEGWWCTYHYQKFGRKSTDVEEHITYMGPPSQEVEDSLKNIQPMDGKLMGRWYLKISCTEKSMFLVQKDSVYYLETHDFADVARGETPLNEIIILQVLNDERTKFGNKERLHEVYSINKDGNMIVESLLAYLGGAVARKY